MIWPNRTPLTTHQQCTTINQAACERAVGRWNIDVSYRNHPREGSGYKYPHEGSGYKVSNTFSSKTSPLRSALLLEPRPFVRYLLRDGSITLRIFYVSIKPPRPTLFRCSTRGDLRSGSPWLHRSRFHGGGALLGARTDCMLFTTRVGSEDFLVS